MKPVLVRYKCVDCGWVGTGVDLVTPGGCGREYHMDGSQCPKCWGDTEEIIPRREAYYGAQERD